MDNNKIVKGVCLLVAAALLCWAAGIPLYNAVAPEIKALPLPSFIVIFFAVFALVGGFVLLIGAKKAAPDFQGALGENSAKTVEKLILTGMLAGGVFMPLYYVWFWWMPSLLETVLITLDKRYILLLVSFLFLPVIGACYYLVYTIWPITGRIAWGLLLSSLIVAVCITVSVSQQPVKLFDLEGRSNIWYHQKDFTPYRLVAGNDRSKFYDQRDGTPLVRLTASTPPAVIEKVGEAAAERGLLRGFKEFLGSKGKQAENSGKQPQPYSEPLEFQRAGDEYMTKMSFAPRDRVKLVITSGRIAKLNGGKEVEELGPGTYWTSSLGGVQVFRAKTTGVEARISLPARR